MKNKIVRFFSAVVAGSLALLLSVGMIPAKKLEASVPSNVSVAVSGGNSDIKNGQTALTYNVSVASDKQVNGITIVFYHTQLGTSLTGVATNLTGNGGVYSVNLLIPANANLGTYKLGTVYVSNTDGGVAFYDSSAIPNGNTPSSINRQPMSLSNVSFDVYNSRSDSTPPTLRDITLNRHIGTDTDKSYVEVCLSVQDNYEVTTAQLNSGVATVDFAFENSNGSWVSSSTSVTKGPDGYYHGIIYDENVRDSGVYVLHYLALKDNAGNTAIYNKTGGNLTTSESMMKYFKSDLDYISFRVYGNSATIIKPENTTTQAASTSVGTSDSSPKTGELSNVYIPVIVLAMVVLAAVGVVCVNARRRED